MELNVEKQQLYRVIQYIKGLIAEHQAFYNKLNDLYEGDLASAKRLTEKIYNDINSNFESSNTEMYQIAGSMNGQVQAMRTNIGNVLNEMSYWIQEQQIKLNKLQYQYDHMS